ncbi:MAG: phage tail tube protein [Candidatus Brocadiaceae bacterium]|nr:phage tail tube protein [Candidatus Brocadiaceae bacterium]
MPTTEHRLKEDMTQATVRNVRLAYAEETSFGVVPPSPLMTVLPLIKEGLNLQDRNFSTARKGEERVLTATSAGPLEVGGRLDLFLELESIGTLLKHALGSATTTGSSAPYTHLLLGSGSLPPGLSIEKAFLDINRFLHFKGCRIDHLGLIFPPTGGPVRVELYLLTKGVDVLSGQLASGLTETQTLPLAYNLSLEEGGLAVGGPLGVELILENHLFKAGHALGSRERYFLGPGVRRVSGSLVLGTEDMGYLSKYLALNSTSLKIKVTAPSGSSLEVSLPRVVFTGQISSVTGRDGAVQQGLSFLALKDNGLGTDMKVTLINNQPKV